MLAHLDSRVPGSGEVGEERLAQQAQPAAQIENAANGDPEMVEVAAEEPRLGLDVGWARDAGAGVDVEPLVEGGIESTPNFRGWSVARDDALPGRLGHRRPRIFADRA